MPRKTRARAREIIHNFLDENAGFAIFCLSKLKSARELLFIKRQLSTKHIFELMRPSYYNRVNAARECAGEIFVGGFFLFLTEP